MSPPKKLERARRPLAGAILVLGPSLLWFIDPDWGHDYISAHYLQFHTTLELLAVIVSLLMFSTAWNIKNLSHPVITPLFGAAFLGVGVLDFMHLLSHPGMPEFLTKNLPDKAILFGLNARVLQSFALLGYVLNPRAFVREENLRWVGAAIVAVYVAVTCSLGFVAPDWIPPAYLAGVGPSPFVIACEWIAIGVLASALLLHSNTEEIAGRPNLLAISLWLLIGAELIFIRHTQLDDWLNVLGHLYKTAAYALLYRSLFVGTVQAHMASHDNLCKESTALLLEAAEGRAQLRRLIDSAPDGLLIINRHGLITLSNPMIFTLFGYAPEELHGQSVETLFPEELGRSHANQRMDWRIEPGEKPMGGTPINCKAKRRDGTEFFADISLSVMGGLENTVLDGTLIAFVRDISERKQIEDELRYLATHDELTGLPNRWLLGDLLRRVLVRSWKIQSKSSILLMDLDNFKLINDNFGHSQGDILLQEIGRRLSRTTARENTLARIGGDEFALLLNELTSSTEAQAVAENILHLLAEPLWIDGHEISPSISIGISIFPDDGESGEALLRHAEIAMYKAKEAGRGCWVSYAKTMEESASDDLRILARLRHAMEGDAFMLWYQPQVETTTGRILGAEALIRWHDEELGTVSPARFIPLAEASGLILPIGDWVLETACRQISAWQIDGFDLKIAINISPQQFHQNNLVEKIRTALVRHNCPAHLLEIEITESTTMQAPEFARTQLEELKELGLSIALDDFGTGHSSLARLATLPIHKLKIDRSFIIEIPGNSQYETIVRTTIHLVADLGMRLIAEGVETEAQRAFLEQHGCLAYQGWLFSKALEAKQFKELFCDRQFESAI